MRILARAALAAAGAAGVAVEVWSVRPGWSWGAAALDLLAGLSLLAASGWAGHATAGCRTLLALSGLAWFLATPQVVSGWVGHDAALLGGVWLAPLAMAMLALPAAVPPGKTGRAAAAAAWVRAVPALAAVGWLTALTGCGLAVAAAADARHEVFRLPRAAAATLGVLTGAAGVVQEVTGHGSVFEPFVAVAVAVCGITVLAVRQAGATTGSGVAGLVVELGTTTDALSLQSRLARAIGDPRLRLLYQLAPGLPFVTASGLTADGTPTGRTVTVMGQSGPVVAALEHDSSALTDPRLRQAVLAVGRLAVRRLMGAAEAARHSVELADSRRRLVEADAVARQQFASDVADGPARFVARCVAFLDEALAAAPLDLRGNVSAARAAALTAREELAGIAAGDAGRMLAHGDLAAALVELARSAGGDASVRIGGVIDPGLSGVAWFMAAEAVTNALKHAGPARIWLSAAVEADVLRVRVEDDGVGGADPAGRGLRGLAGRLAEHGGRLQVRGREHGGTVVTAEIPLRDSGGRPTGAAPQVLTESRP
jgi:signal transduction histidine kinase